MKSLKTKKKKKKSKEQQDSTPIESLSKKEKKALKLQRKKEKEQEDYEKRAAKLEREAEKQSIKNRKALKKIITDYQKPTTLTRDEWEFYKKIGRPAPEGDQNYLELFDDLMIHDLRVMMNTTFIGPNGQEMSSNHRVADLIMDELSSAGFKPMWGKTGLGTNIVVLRHKKYPGVVFKIALDKYGIADNINDERFYNRFPDMYARFICRHPTGIVSVQEAYAPILGKDRMDDLKGRAYDMITRLEKDYIIVDLSPVNYKNYGITRDGRLVIIDGSDLIRKPKGVDLMRCKKRIGMLENGKTAVCGHKLQYTEDYNRVICPVCEAVYMPWDLKPRVVTSEEESLLMINTGMTPSEMRQLNKYIDQLIEKYHEEHPEENEPLDDQKVDAELTVDDLDLPDDESRQRFQDELKKLEDAEHTGESQLIGDNDIFGIDKDDDDEEDEDEEYGDGVSASDDQDANLSLSDMFRRDLYETFGVRDEVRRLAEEEETDDDEEDELEDEEPVPAETKLSAEITNEVEVITPSMDVESHASVGEDETEGGVLVQPPDSQASLDVVYSEDPCALNIALTGSLSKAFSENGPAIYMSLDGGDEYIELMSGSTFGQLLGKLLENKGLDYIK